MLVVVVGRAEKRVHESTVRKEAAERRLRRLVTAIEELADTIMVPELQSLG